MPDLQTELAKVNDALKEWGEEPTTMTQSRNYNFRPTNNVSRDTFYAIKHNPGIARAALVPMLTSKGFNPKSVYALVRQMVAQGHVKDTDGKLVAMIPEYTPLKAPPKTKVKAPPRVEPEIAPMPPGLRFRATAAELLDTLSITQARELYDELRKIFGG